MHGRVMHGHTPLLPLLRGDMLFRNIHRFLYVCVGGSQHGLAEPQRALKAENSGREGARGRALL